MPLLFIPENEMAMGKAFNPKADNLKDRRLGSMDERLVLHLFY
jgi:hypothetical protein